MSKKMQSLINHIIELKKNYDKNIESLIAISELKDDQKVIFTSNDGHDVELPDSYREGFKIGILAAVDVLGDFGIKVEESKESDESDKEELRKIWNASEQNMRATFSSSAYKGLTFDDYYKQLKEE